MGKVKHYPEETKRYAINKVLIDHVNIHDICNELGCGYTTIKKWISEFQELGEAFFAPKGSFFVYIHIAPDKQRKVYIGITRQNPLLRWDYGNGYASNKYFSRAIKKYGWDNFEHKILRYGLTHKEANDLEIELIKKYRSKDRRYGYNQTDGGDGSHGVIVSKKTREKLSKVSKGIPLKEEHKGKISVANGHPVKQYSLEGKYIKTFHSTGEAARQLGKNSERQAHIVACCNGKRHRAYGYRWSWAEDSKPPIELEGNFPQSRRVSQYHLDGRYIKTYSNMRQAGIELRNSKRAGDNIQFCCTGRIDNAYGYIWRYADSEDTNDIEGLRGHPRYGDVKCYLAEGHTKVEACAKFDITIASLHRYLKKAEISHLDDNECLK